MDGHRFDSLARTLAIRRSRRGAVRTAAGVAAGFLGFTHLRSSHVLAADAPNRYTGIRRYASGATSNEIKAGFADLLPQLRQIGGFLDYSVINGAGDEYLTIAVFLDKEGVEAAEALEKEWVAANLPDLLLTPPGKLGGPVLLHDGVCPGSPCSTGTENPCGSDAFVCCGGPDTPPGGTGVCVEAQIGCAPPVSTCGELGAPCSTPEECCEFLTCFEAQCDNPRGCFPEGGPCSSDDECCDGPCQEDGTCSGAPACKAPGDPCEMVPEHGCCEGYTCFEGICDNPRGCFDSGGPCTSDEECCQGSCSDEGICYCTDPSRPDIGCACDAEDTSTCGGRPELCCNGTCISPMANC